MRSRIIYLGIFLLISILFINSCRKELDEKVIIMTGEALQVGVKTASLNGEVIDVGSGIKHYGHCWNESGTPDINDDTTDLGVMKKGDAYISKIGNLKANTVYSYRAYATDGGPVVYGETKTITTNDYGLAKLTITQTSNPSMDGVDVKATVTSLGDGIDSVTAYGFYWGEKSSPDMNDSVCNLKKLKDVPKDFTHHIGNLKSNTTYYVRAYAVNQKGVGYGDPVTSFKTLSPAVHAPVFTSTPVSSVSEDALYSYQIAATDQDGDQLNYSAPVKPAWLSFNTSTHFLSGTPTNAEVGSHNVTLRVSDGTLNTDQIFVITVVNVNDPPAITSSPATTSVAVGSNFTYQVVANDPDAGDVLSYSAVVLPSWLSFNSTSHTFSGTPSKSNIGDNNVMVRVSDGDVNTDQQFVITVYGIAHTPVITSTPVTSVPEDALYSYQITATDEDGDLLTYSAQVKPAWLSFNTSTHVLSGTPTNAEVGNHNVTLRVSDGTLYADQKFEIRVDNVNDAPVITSSPATSVTINSTYTYQVVANDPDVGDVLSYSAVVLPSGFSFNSTNHTLIGTPTSSDPSSLDVLLRVSDGEVYTEQSFSIIVDFEKSTVTDTDGKVYITIKIGEQWWMAQNLNKGTRINGTGNMSNNLITEKYCYDNLESNCTMYGGLYQWDEMMHYNTSDDGNPGRQVQGVCPSGYHIPTDSEWQELEIHLGMSPLEANETGFRGINMGGTLKEEGYIHWDSPNNSADNSSGFTALPAGNRATDATFGRLHQSCYFWMATDNGSTEGWRRSLDYSGSTVGRYHYDKKYGYSVRCIKDQ
jgi:uncharacterized protein (TIGR02145 family)